MENLGVLELLKEKHKFIFALDGEAGNNGSIRSLIEGKKKMEEEIGQMLSHMSKQAFLFYRLRCQAA